MALADLYKVAQQAAAQGVARAQAQQQAQPDAQPVAVPRPSLADITKQAMAQGVARSQEPFSGNATTHMLDNMKQAWTQAQTTAQAQMAPVQARLPAQGNTIGIFGGGGPASAMTPQSGAAPASQLVKIGGAVEAPSALGSMHVIGTPQQTPQQLALMSKIAQSLAQPRAQQQASVPATPQSMINNRGVFAGGQMQAAAPASGPQALPALQPTGGIAPRGGA